MANPAIVVDFVANTKDLQKGFKDAEGHASGFSSKLKGLATGGAIAGIAALGAGLKIGVDEFAEASKVGAQTNAVLKSTGKAAGVTAKGVDDLAGSIMKKTGIDDEAIQSGENLLLTFTNVRNEAGKGNDVFNQATQTMTDMSAALGQDMKASSIQLGKALNDPIKGVSALSEVGVTFTDQQKKQIEAMQKAGDMAGAQKVILAELNKEFGGSAEAAGKTLPGQINILKESFSNFAGMLVGKVVPILQSAIAWLRDHWPEISAAFGAFWASVQPILDNLWGLLKQVVQVVQDNWPLIAPILESLGQQVKDMATIVSNALKLVTDLIRGDWKAAWQDIKNIVGAALDLIKERLINTPVAVAKLALAIGKAIFGGIRDGVGALGGWMAERIGDVRDAMTNAAASVYEKAKDVGEKIIGGVKAGAVGIYTWVHDKIQDAIDAMQGFLDADTIKNKAEQIGKAVYEGIKAGLTGIAKLLKDTVIGAVNEVIKAVNKFKIPGLPGKFKKIFGGWSGFNIPLIPLAAGGIVTRPTMALIGEAGPEAVVPLTGGTGNAPIEVRVFIGDTELRGLVRTEIVDTNTNIARTLLAGAA